MAMPRSVAYSTTIRDIECLSELKDMLRLEKEIWGLADADVTPLTLAIALRAAGGISLGAFDRGELVGFASAFPSLDEGRVGFHSHMLAVHPGSRERGLGFRLKLAQRERALAIGVKEMTWTFDPLRSKNAHLNFSKLGVISDTYKADFYGNQSSSPLFRNSTDRLWVRWHMADSRVEARLNGKETGALALDSLSHLEPLVRFNGAGRPALADVTAALSRQRVAIEIPGDIERVESEDKALAREWRLRTRQAFTEALEAGFIVKEFCRSIRGQQGPGAYLLERGGE
jgi:predicted GNAT superfamily acetyltransferase